jgi:hypothetical protein
MINHNEYNLIQDILKFSNKNGKKLYPNGEISFKNKNFQLEICFSNREMHKDSYTHKNNMKSFYIFVNTFRAKSYEYTRDDNLVHEIVHVLQYLNKSLDKENELKKNSYIKYGWNEENEQEYYYRMYFENPLDTEIEAFFISFLYLIKNRNYYLIKRDFIEGRGCIFLKNISCVKFRKFADLFELNNDDLKLFSRYLYKSIKTKISKLNKNTISVFIAFDLENILILLKLLNIGKSILELLINTLIELDNSKIKMIQLYAKKITRDKYEQ